MIKVKAQRRTRSKRLAKDPSLATGFELATGHCSLTTDSDSELMRRVQADEPGAFAELVEGYWPRVFGRFCRQLRDRQEAEDLTQDVFLRVFRSRRRWQPRAKLATWIFHISRNVTRNALRTKRRRPCINLSSVGDRSTPLRLPRGVRGELPHAVLERSEAACLVRSAVADLACRQRRALELFQFQHQSCAQIAAELDMSSKATRSLLYRARNQVRLGLLPYREACMS
jgi:RNA polymerase sigma-70 factor (ECF subfamily)